MSTRPHTARTGERTGTRLVLGALLATLVLGACRTTEGQSSGPEEAQSMVAAPTGLADLPEKTLGTPPALRLTPGLTPPTNHWFSGLVFPEQPQPVFPSPLSYTPTASGFDVGVPQVTTSAATIMGSAASDIQVQVGTGDFVVTRYDDASLTLTLLGDGDGSTAGDPPSSAPASAVPTATDTDTTDTAPSGASSPAAPTPTVPTPHGPALLDVTLAEGSPVVGLSAHAPLELTLSAQSWRALDGSDQWVGTSTSGRSWVVTAPTGASAAAGVLTLPLDIDEGAALVAAPDGHTPAAGDATATATPVTATRAEHTERDGQSFTTLDYTTADGSPTLLTSAPHQGACPSEEGTYPSVNGTLTACTAHSLEWGATLVDARDRLDLSHLDDSQREELATQVRADAAATREMPADTYFGGKALQREASLMLLAEELGLEEAPALRAEVTAALRTWAEPAGCDSRDERCFTFDPLQRLVVGQTIAFGSETANDAHFHLGYFLSAAAMVGADDPALVAEIAPVIDALAETVGAEGTSTFAPRLRTFDPYWSHSWASGWAPFADGNNQESVSEAVNAWNGLALWAKVRGQSDLEHRATWMLSMEAHASHAYWTDFDRSEPVYRGFDHTVVSLEWGGKRDWATWFSPEPSAMLGILVIPAPPVADYLAGDPDRIRENLEEALAGAEDHDVMFGDQLLMYRSLAGPEDAAAALELARSLPEERIDDGNTRSYLMAFIMSHLR